MSRKRCLLLLLWAAAGVLFGAGEARACSCGQRPTVLEEYEQADVVVVVSVVSVKRGAQEADAKAGAKPGAPAEEARADYTSVVSTETAVEKVYKGNLKVGDAMTFGQGGGGDCIWTFDDDDIGTKLLFYLKRPADGDTWFAVECGRSRGFGHANDDLLYLNKLDRVRGRTRVSGTILFHGADAPGVAGRRIRVTGAGKTHEVRTDEHGVYEIYDLPPGKYAVEPEAPHGWKLGVLGLRRSPSFTWPAEEKTLRKIPFVLEEKKHAGLDLVFEMDNAVRGKVYDATGRPMSGVCLKLVPADGSEGPNRFGCTKAGGAFEIDVIQPGRYVIVVNDDGEVTSSEPFGRFYYPNVYRREDATVFEVGAGDFVEDVQIYAPQTEETVTVEGVFLYSDGKPVADESVVFLTGQPGEERSDAGARTDAKGRFSIKLLKGRPGRLRGEMYAYVGEFENCPKLDDAIRQTGSRFSKIGTRAAEVRADTNLYGVELRYPFPGCRKAK